MNIMKMIAAFALLSLSATSQAWWGGPGWGNGWNDGSGNFLGDGDFSFGISAHGHGNGYGYGNGNYYDGYGPYGPYAYGPYGAPYYGYSPALYGAPYGTAPVMPAVNTRQSKAVQDAVEAQQKAAENLQKVLDEQRQALIDAQQKAYQQHLAGMNVAPSTESGRSSK